MSPSADDAAWERLGILLRQRRIDLDLRYRRRTAFERERAAGINARMLQDIENGSRGGYSADNKRAMEKAYGLKGGNIDAILAGGALEPEEPDLSSFTAEQQQVIKGIARLLAAQERESRERSA